MSSSRGEDHPHDLKALEPRVTHVGGDDLDALVDVLVLLYDRRRQRLNLQQKELPETAPGSSVGSV